MPPANSSSGRLVVLFRVKGVEIAFTPSWLLMFTLLALVFRSQVVPEDVDRVAGAAIAVGLSMLFYVFVLLHEAAHTAVAHVFGLQPRRIVLFMLGGVSQIGRDAEEPKQEYLVALAGPLASLVIAGALALVTRASGQAFDGIWGTLAAVNLLLALFNLVPGFPLDGGRVLRSTMWAITGNRIRATRAAATGGRVVAAGLVAGGVAYMLWRSEGIADAAWGIWYVVLGWFLYSHATIAGREEVQRELLREQTRREAAAAAAAQTVLPPADIIPASPVPKPPPKRKARPSRAKPAKPVAKPRAAGASTKAPAKRAASSGVSAVDIVPEPNRGGRMTRAKPAARLKNPSRARTADEGNPAKSQANRGRGRSEDRSRSAASSRDQSRDGARDSRR